LLTTDSFREMTGIEIAQSPEMGRKNVHNSGTGRSYPKIFHIQLEKL
jgi:hypothetical protein